MSEPVEEEIKPESKVPIDEFGLEIPQYRQRGSVMAPPPPKESREYRRKRSMKKQEIRMEKLRDNPPEPKNPRVPFSTRVETIPGTAIHIFSTPVDGEATDIKIQIKEGSSQGPVVLQFIRTSGNNTEIRKIVAEQGKLVEFTEQIPMKIGDEFLVQAEIALDLVATMMFREI